MSICRSTPICRDRIPRSASLHGTEGQSTRGLHPCGPIQGSSRRSVTATLRFASHRGRTLVTKKFTHENNFCKPPPDNLRGTTRNQLLVVQIVAMIHAEFDSRSDARRLLDNATALGQSRGHKCPRYRIRSSAQLSRQEFFCLSRSGIHYCSTRYPSISA